MPIKLTEKGEKFYKDLFHGNEATLEGPTFYGEDLYWTIHILNKDTYRYIIKDSLELKALVDLGLVVIE